MKNILFILSLSFLILFSCSSGDENNTSTNMLVGTWQFDKEGLFDTGTIVSSNVVLQGDYVHECISTKDFIIFGEDQNGISAWYDGNCIENLSTFSWSRTEDVILITIDNETENFKIVRLTNNELVIYSPPDADGQPDFLVTGFIKQ